MLVLSRRKGERILIGDGIEIVVVDVRPGSVRLAFKAPPEVPILREELRRRLDAVGSPGEPSADVVPEVRRRTRAGRVVAPAKEPVGESRG